MRERRESPRRRCRLHCRIRRREDRIRARVLDLSEGGLCVMAPILLKKGEKLELEIDVPGQALCRAHAEVWHVRKTRGQHSGRSVWVSGLILLKADDCYADLLPAAEVGEVAALPRADVPEDGDELRVFRVRVQEYGGPRTRLLTLSATSAAEARDLAVADLGDAWLVSDLRQR